MGYDNGDRTWGEGGGDGRLPRLCGCRRRCAVDRPMRAEDRDGYIGAFRKRRRKRIFRKKSG